MRCPPRPLELSQLAAITLLAACGSGEQKTPSSSSGDASSMADGSGPRDGGALEGGAIDGHASSDATDLDDRAENDGAADLCSPQCSAGVRCVDGGCELCAADGGTCTCLVSCSNALVGRGDGTMWSYPAANMAPVEVTGADGVPLVASSFASGFDLSCAVGLDHTVLCWSMAGGSNTYGQLGNGADAVSATPAPVVTSPGGPPLSNATQVAFDPASDVVVCAIGEAGAVWCWGLSYYGALGNGTTTDSSFAVPVVTASGGPPFAGAVQLSVSETHACARKGDGTLWCWGDTTGYDGNIHPYPVQVTALSNEVVDVTVDLTATCAVKTDGTVWCWGDTEEDGFGGAVTDIDDPFQLTQQNGTTFTDALQVTGEENAVCVLTSGGSIQCNGGIGETLAPNGALFMGRGISYPCLIDNDGTFHQVGYPESAPVSCP
jgi:hypothetical protein